MEYNANINMKHSDENMMQIICVANNYQMLLCINMSKKFWG